MWNSLKIFIAILLITGCKSETNSPKLQADSPLVVRNELPAEIVEFNTQEFERQSSFDSLKNKMENGETITIHLRIPLCDNKNQGIMPVSETLGNGLDLKNNLYWGAKYGFKNHFRRHTDWSLVSSELDITDEILERVVLSKNLASGSTAYIVADAYRGDKMKKCLTDYFSSLSGNNMEETQINKETIGLSSNADLLIFNGHNGLMDFNLELTASKDEVIRGTSVIGCVSHYYFKEHLLASNGYPIIMTTNLMAPEAYVVESVIDSWLKLEEGTEIRKSAGRGYHKYQKCGITEATKLFRTGW